MRCEVVAIGTELLLGIIVDGNSAWIGEQLALAGIDSHFQVKVGDNFGRIEACIRQALERSDAVICCGGLGPTQDDITRDVIARVMGVEMRRDQAIADKIRQHLRVARPRDVGQQPAPGRYTRSAPARSRRCPARRRGSSARSATRSIYAVPGVPSEMREMVARHHPARPAPAHGPDRGHPQPRAAHLGRERVRRRRDGGGPRRRARQARQSHHRLPGQRHRRHQGAHRRQVRRRGDGQARARQRGGADARPARATWCSASTSSRWRRSCSEQLRKRGMTAGGHRDADRRHPVGAHERARPGDGGVPRRRSCVPKLQPRGRVQPRPSSAPARLPRRRASVSAPRSGWRRSCRKPPRIMGRERYSSGWRSGTRSTSTRSCSPRTASACASSG